MSEAGGSPARVTVFDLDRTLTSRGSHTPFILYCLGQRPWQGFWIPVVLLLGLGYALGLVGRTGMKNAMLRAVLAGVAKERARELGEAFAARWRQRTLRPKLMDRLTHHLQQGDRVLLATASFDLYATPLGHALGVDEILATHVEIDRRGRLTGRIDGENCFGAEKLRRVLERLPQNRDSCYLTVYSDDVSDLELLRTADEGFVVAPKPGFAAAARSAGLTIIEDV